MSNNLLHHTIHGRGPTVVLLHGFLEDSSMWDFCLPVLSEQYTVITVDLPGHGKSPSYGAVHSMELMAEKVHDVLEHAQVNEALLVGHSMGGYAALAFGDMYPEKTKGISLFHSTALADNEQKKIDRNRVIEAVQDGTSLFVKTALPNLFMDPQRDAEHVERLMADALKLPIQTIQAAAAGMRDRPDRLNVLKQDAFPVQLIAGDQDPVIPLKRIEEQLRLTQPYAHVLPNTGHMGQLENPEMAKDCLIEFCAACYEA